MKRFCSSVLSWSPPVFFILLGGVPAVAHAYIGPGAGFAFVGSTFVLLLTLLMGLATVIIGPFI